MNDDISRKATLEAIQRHFNPTGEEMPTEVAAVLVGVGVVISTQPSTDRKGHWVKRIHVIKTKNMEETMPIWNCSECGRAYDPFTADRFINFCPECGADMRGEQND